MHIFINEMPFNLTSLHYYAFCYMFISIYTMKLDENLVRLFYFFIALRKMERKKE